MSMKNIYLSPDCLELPVGASQVLCVSAGSEINDLVQDDSLNGLFV